MHDAKLKMCTKQERIGCPAVSNLKDRVADLADTPGASVHQHEIGTIANPMEAMRRALYAIDDIVMEGVVRGKE